MSIIPPAAWEGPQLAQFLIGGPYDQVFPALLRAVAGAKVKVRNYDETLGFVRGSTGWTLTSYGERLDLAVLPLDGARCRVLIGGESKAAYLGSNQTQRYVQKIGKVLSQQFLVSSWEHNRVGPVVVRERLQQQGLLQYVERFVAKTDDLNVVDFLVGSAQFTPAELDAIESVGILAEFMDVGSRAGIVTSEQLTEQWGIMPKLAKLRMLLAAKGQDVHLADLAELVAQEAKEQAHGILREVAFPEGHPDNLPAMAHRITNHYGSTAPFLIDAFCTILDWEGFQYETAELETALRQSTGGKYVADFERELMDD